MAFSTYVIFQHNVNNMMASLVETDLVWEIPSAFTFHFSLHGERDNGEHDNEILASCPPALSPEENG